MAHATDHEAAWIARVVVADDHAAFACLVRLHQASVRRFLLRLCRDDWSRADDLAQDTFLKAWRHIGDFRGEGRFVGWLLRIAWQLFVSQQRRHRGVRHESWTEQRHGQAPASSGDPSVDIVDRHTLDRLLDELRDEERAVIVLHYRHQLTHAEVATALDMPLGSVKTLIRRARHKLQQAYAATPTPEGS